MHVVQGVTLEGQGDGKVRKRLIAAGVLLVADLGAVCHHCPLLVHLGEPQTLGEETVTTLRVFEDDDVNNNNNDYDDHACDDYCDTAAAVATGGGHYYDIVDLFRTIS